MGQTNALRIRKGFLGVEILRGIEEAKRADDGAGFAHGGAEAVGGGAPGGGKELSGDDECGGVGSPVGKEERKRVEGDESAIFMRYHIVAAAGSAPTMRTMRHR